MRQAEILVDVLQDSLVVEYIFYKHTECFLNLLVPKSLDRWLPWLELLQRTSANTQLKSGQTRILSLADSLDECIVVALTSEYVAEF